MCECEVCRRKKNRDPLNREFEPKKRVPEPKKEDCEPKKEDCELKKEDCDPKKEDCESLNDYSFSKNANFLKKVKLTKFLKNQLQLSIQQM